MRSGTESNASPTATPSDFTKTIAATAGHAPGCTCWPCQKERKHLREEAEADRKVNIETGLPPVKEEARALFEMIGRNGDTADSLRELICVPPKIEARLLDQTRYSPRGRRGILKVLDFRRRVLAEFEWLLNKEYEQRREMRSESLAAF